MPGPKARPHPGTEWVHVSSLSERTLADPADQVAVQRSLAECDRDAGAVTLGPFARLGWFRELQGWIEEAIAPLGLHLEGSFSQLNASPSFSLVRFETSGPAVWFKAVGNPNLREFPITLALARLLPQYLPPILAARPEWNGWLALEVEGTNLGETQDTQHWNTAASGLAKLQIESIGRFGTLVDFGARDLRVSALLKCWSAHSWMSWANSHGNADEGLHHPFCRGVNSYCSGSRSKRHSSLSTDLVIPDALGHLDLNPGNVIVSEGQCVFLDWAEAFVGHPFFSFQYLVEHFRRIAGVRT